MSRKAVRRPIRAPRATRRRETPTGDKRAGNPPALDLTVPAAVRAVVPEAAEQAVGVPPETASRINAIVADFLDTIVALDPHGAEFARRIAEVGGIAEREIFATSEMSSRLLERPVHAVTGILGAKAPISRNLLELRRTVEDLDPASHDLAWERYQERYGNAQARIQEITWALTESRNRLLADNAALGQEERALWTEMETLRQYAYLVRSLDEGLEERILGLAGTDPDRSRLLRTDVLFPVRQRLQDILTQLAVATQGYAALRIVEQNNQQVIRAIGTATTTTTAALRTAVMVSQAVAAQRLILEELKSAGVTATRGGATGEVAVGDADLAALHQAWDKVLATLDEIDAYTVAARSAMKVTAKELTGQVERSRVTAQEADGPIPPESSSLRL